MSLYDIIDEITERQATKTELGDTRAYGVMVGIVAKNYHADMGGRICVTIPTRDTDANELQWARLSMPSSGKKWGHYFLPEVGDQVLLAFENGNIERPYVVGCIPMDNNNFLTGSVDSQNQYKRIVTRNGSNITFEDSAQATDGSMDTITIQTPSQAHTLLLDNANKAMKLTDKSGDNSIAISTVDGSGSITIKAATNLDILVGDNIKVNMNAQSGTVKITAAQFTVEASSQMQLKSDGMITLDGAQIAEKTSASHKVESSGMASFKGATTKIG